MLYALLKYIEQHFDFPGAGLFQYLSFRSVGAIILSLLLVIIFGKKVINLLSRMQIGEEIRDLGLDGQMEKRGTPTMGGLIILGGVLIPMFLLGDLTNVYVQLMLVATIWLGTIGFMDDYIKVFRKDKNGLKGRFKIIGQVGLGIIVGTVMCFNQEVVVVEKGQRNPVQVETVMAGADQQTAPQKVSDPYETATEVHSGGIQTTKTTIPFIKNNEFDYHWVFPTDKPWGNIMTWILYIVVAILIITAVSNGANLTDGLDGLATGISAIIAVALGIFAYLSGNIIYAEYLDIMYIPGSGELMVFAMALMGALIGFLWFNCHPAQVFMGDTGSLALGGIIATFSLLIRKELLLPLLCGIFFMESLSVIIQVFYFKYTKKRYGEGKRYYLMAPMHHHYQKKNMHENKIVVRFWIIQILLTAVTIATLKIR